MFGGINRLGIFGGPAIGGVLADQAGIHATFGLSAALAALALAMSAILLKPLTRAASSLRASHRWRLVGAGVRAQRARPVGGGDRADTGSDDPRRALPDHPALGSGTARLDAAQVGTIVTAGAILDVSMFIPAGMLMDRFGRKVAAVPSFALMALGIGLIPFTRDFLTLLLVAMLIGLGNGLGSGLMMTLGADLAPPGATGEFLGVWRLIGDVGAVTGPLLVGAVAAAFGLSGGAWVLSVAGWLAVFTWPGWSGRHGSPVGRTRGVGRVG